MSSVQFAEACMAGGSPVSDYVAAGAAAATEEVALHPSQRKSIIRGFPQTQPHKLMVEAVIDL